MGHEAVVGHGDDWLPGSHGPFKGPFKFLCLFFFFFQSLSTKYNLSLSSSCLSLLGVDLLSVVLVSFKRDTSIFRADRVVVPLLVSATV